MVVVVPQEEDDRDVERGPVRLLAPFVKRTTSQVDRNGIPRDQD